MPCRVMKSVVDELIAEVAAEEQALQGSADAFAFALLVEAVASSQGKLRQSKALNQLHQASVQRLEPASHPNVQAASSSTGGPTVPRISEDTGLDAVEGLEDEEAVYRARRTYNDGGTQASSAQSLYLGGLRAMLQEMRRRRPPDTPYGHTQQLQMQLRQKSRISKASVHQYQASLSMMILPLNCVVVFPLSGQGGTRNARVLLAPRM